MDALIVAKFKKMELVNADGRTMVTSIDIRPADDDTKVILYGNSFEFIELNSKITAIAYMEDGIVLMDALVTISTEMQVNLEILKTHEKQERRNALKVKVNFSSRIVKVQSNGKKQRHLYQSSAIEAKDLSMGGICFFCNRPFFKNQVVDIILNPVKQGMTGRAVILRRNRLRDSGYRYKYGCRFVGLSGEQERAICEYVFKMQLIDYQRKQDLELR